MGSPTASDLPFEILELLRQLSGELVAAQLDSTKQIQPATIITKAAPLFAALHRVNRDVLFAGKVSKARTHDARLEMDSAHLRLQNLMFERNHLIREIKQCEEFESEYTSLPLITEEHFLQLASSPSPPPGLRVPSSLEDSHDVMLARLEFELAERQRFDEEKKALGLRKAQLVKENEKKKRSLDEIEARLDGQVESARELQVAMHEAEEDQPMAVEA